MENIAAIALSNQIVLRRQMEIIANNMANISTPGFKGQNLAFKEYIDKGDVGDDRTSYVNAAGVNTDYTQGSMQHTGSDFDLAINGEGYFTIGGPNGTRYTRNGNFRPDSNGQLVSGTGDPVLNTNGTPIIIPSAADKITVSQNGGVYAGTTLLGRVGIVKFANADLLEREDSGLYMLPAGSNETPEPVERPRIYQGMLEGSNVEGILEMTKMMEVSRAYESAQKVVEKEDDRLRNAMRRLSQTQ